MTQMPSSMPLRRMILVPILGLLLATFFLICVLWNLVPYEDQCLVEECIESSSAPSSSSSSSEIDMGFSGIHQVDDDRGGGAAAGTPEADQEPSDEELAMKKQEIINSMRIFSAAQQQPKKQGWESYKWWRLSPETSSNHRPRLIKEKSSDSCSGKHIYIYKLPPKFNTDILKLCHSFLPWLSMCDYFTNSGMGVPVRSSNLSSTSNVLIPEGRWFQTNQYALDVVFHKRLLRYPCLTESPEEAVMFYVPYYAGLDVLRYHYVNVTLEEKNELGLELMQWLKKQRSWWKNRGRDHVLVLGKITWDFRRNNETMWGNTLLKMPDFQNLMKLLIEREPWEPNEIGVPHPTYFHPASDSDISSWISLIATSNRKHLISFAGMPRDPDHIRTVLINHCQKSPVLCELLACAGNVCYSPEPTMDLFMSSHFCMQPPGDSATRRSVFDSLIAGCIPVLFDTDTAYFQYPWHLPKDSSSYSVYISSDDVKKGRVDVIKVVAGISEEQRLSMRRKIIYEIVPGLLYSQPGAKLVQYEDAFDISIRSLLNKVASL